MKRRYYPAALNVRGRACLVIGDDAEADEKAARLTESGAVVTRRSTYRPGDITDQFLVLLAIKTDPALSRAVADECRARRVLLAAIDQPELSDVAQVALVERGPLQIAVSTDGHAPALAKRIRQGLAASLDETPMVAFLDHLAALRQRLEREIPDPAERRKALIAAVADFEVRAAFRFPADWAPPAAPDR